MKATDMVSFICAPMFVSGTLALVFARLEINSLALVAALISLGQLPVLIRALIWDWHDWADDQKWDSVEFTAESEIPDIVRHQIANIEQRGRRLAAIHISFDDSFKEKRVGKVSVETVAQSERTTAEWLRYVFFLSGPPKPIGNKGGQGTTKGD